MLLAWTGSHQCPPRVVLCTPSMSTEAWVMKMFFPSDGEMKRIGWEAHPNPEARLAQQPKKSRFGKHFKDYASRAEVMKNEWPRVAEALSMAKLFRDDFARAVAI